MCQPDGCLALTPVLSQLIGRHWQSDYGLYNSCVMVEVRLLPFISLLYNSDLYSDGGKVVLSTVRCKESVNRCLANL